jgi:NPCBM/NEW2 domain
MLKVNMMEKRNVRTKRSINRFKAILLVPFVGMIFVAAGPRAFGADALPTCTQKRAGQVVGDRACVRTNGKWAWRDLVPVTAAPSANPPATQAPRSSQKQVFLADTNPVVTPQEGQKVGAAKISGTTYPKSLRCFLYNAYERPSEWQFDLSRKFTTFSSTFGLEDSSNSKGVVHVQVFADGELRYESSLPFGQSDPISIDVTNVLRLKVLAELTPISSIETYFAMGTPSVV